MVFSLDEIGRGFFERIRKELVLLGRLPDVTLYSDAEQFEAACNALPKLTEVFGVGNRTSRGLKKTSRIFVNRLETEPGNVGFDGMEDTFDGNNFTERKYPKTTVNVTFEIRWMGKESEEDAFLTMLIYRLFESFGFLSGIKSDGQPTTAKFRYGNAQGFDVSGDGEFFERGFRYKVSDVFIYSHAEEEQTVAPLGDYGAETLLIQ